MEIGNKARLIQPEIKGEIIDTAFNRNTKKLQHLITWKDETGESQYRWFDEAQLEEVK